MKDAMLAAAAEINELWRQCIADGIQPESCPSNEMIAQIIERHMNDFNRSEDSHHEQ